MKTKVLMAGDHQYFRNGMKEWITAAEDMELTDHVSEASKLAEIVASKMPDVLITEDNILGPDPSAQISKLRAMKPGMKILLLSKSETDRDLLDLLIFKSDGYLLSDNRDEVLFAIRKLAKNGVYIPSELSLALIEKCGPMDGRNGKKSPADFKITAREMDVLTRVAGGMTNAEIARELFTSVRTIETRRKNLLDKTQTTNTATLIRFALLNGLLD